MIKPRLSRSGGCPRRFSARRDPRYDDKGTSAIEFALLSPVFCLLLAGAIDFGGVLYTKFNLDGAVSAAANFGVLNAASVGSSGGSSLATSLATIVASGHSAAWANAIVVVNDGPTATLTGGVITSSGTASNADSCYCPTKAGSTVTWGAALTCGTTCTGGGVAGKFVSIVATHTYNKVFASYGFISNNTISASTVLETQ